MEINGSQRLSYRFITAKDADFLWHLDQDEAVMRYITGGKKTSMADIHGVFLPRLQAYADENLGWGMWKVSLKASPHQGIGWVLVRPMGFFTSQRQPGNIELGWRFHRESWGNGYATEAATAVRDGQLKLGIKQFSAIALPENRASINVMEKLGMSFSHHLHYQDAHFDEQVVVYTQHFQ
ncbi:N-acetyltransferase [Alteromonas aestuariivivens]|uniref:N-acetyltransferase n=1 Tax=Alteromonas aestuariivivens TaxID=1938339 RepID=A0A3D8M3Y3_9ALTE|nr:GNAT family N-acetyltransferase [Alteromonas aestuariivivens]RDV24265.1 N-acetyltransferase [Alteromonas aestuariivivens]